MTRQVRDRELALAARVGPLESLRRCGAAPASAPREDRLLEVVDAGRATVQADLAELVDDRRRRRVDVRLDHRDRDHRPIALRDPPEVRHVGMLEHA